jgi:hypothetical protein
LKRRGTEGAEDSEGKCKSLPRIDADKRGSEQSQNLETRTEERRTRRN